MKLILVRHGESEGNLNHILRGLDDDKLTKKGIEQAKNVGKELKEKHKIDMVFCSPLSRCVQTLENILDECPIDGEILMSKLIEERDFGEYTGMEAVLIDWEDINKDNKINREMGVESLIDLKKRTDLFLEDLKLENEDYTILVISHTGPIKMMVNKLTGKGYEDIEIKNGEILVFDELK